MNSKKRRILISLKILALSSGVVGCHSFISTGHYEGTYGRFQDQEWNETPVQLEVSQNHSDHFQIKIQSQEEKEFPSIDLSLTGRKRNRQIRMDAQWLSENPITLHSVPKYQVSQRLNPQEVGEPIQCFVSEKPLWVEVCKEKTQFSLRVFNQFHVLTQSLSARLYHEVSPLILEQPRSLDLSEAIQIGLTQSFDLKIRYQQWIQSHYEAKAAYLNLIPHLTTNLIWNAQPNFITFVATLQSWAPFILPSYWIQAANAKTMSEIKNMELTGLRRGLIGTVEELSYALNRDQALLRIEMNAKEEFLNFAKTVDFLPDPQVAKVLHSFAYAVLESLESDIADITGVIQEDRYALATTLGFHNIEAVESISLGSEKVPVERAKKLDLTDTGNRAVQRSLELEQIYLAKKIAKRSRWENLFHWLDPAGDPKQGLGFNIGAQQKARVARLQEIEEQKDQLHTQTLNSTHRLVRKYNEAIDTHFLVLDEMKKDNFRANDLFNLTVDDLLTFDVEENKRSALKHVGHLIAEQVSLANFRIARAKLDRILCQGYCTLLMPMMESQNTETGFLTKDLLPHE